MKRTLFYIALSLIAFIASCYANINVSVKTTGSRLDAKSAVESAVKNYLTKIPDVAIVPADESDIMIFILTDQIGQMYIFSTTVTDSVGRLEKYSLSHVGTSRIKESVADVVSEINTSVFQKVRKDLATKN